MLLPPKVPKEEVRVRLRECCKIFPIRRIARMMKMGLYDLHLFRNGAKPRHLQDIGPYRLKKLLAICEKIETGQLVWNGRSGNGSIVKEQEANRPPAVVHRVMFDGKGPALLKGQQTQVEKMPSFSNLFAGKPALLLPKVLKSR